MKKQYIWKVKVVTDDIWDGVCLRGTLIRHIIYVDTVTTLKNIKKNYYKKYRKFGGDQFIIVDKDGGEHYE